MENISTWYGQPVQELDREELIKVINHLSKELAVHRTRKAIRAHAIGSAQMLRDGSPEFTADTA